MVRGGGGGGGDGRTSSSQVFKAFQMHSVNYLVGFQCMPRCSNDVGSKRGGFE